MKIIGVLIVVVIIGLLFARQQAALEKAEHEAAIETAAALPEVSPAAHSVYARALDNAHAVADQVRAQQAAAAHED